MSSHVSLQATPHKQAGQQKPLLLNTPLSPRCFADQRRFKALCRAFKPTTGLTVEKKVTCSFRHFDYLSMLQFRAMMQAAAAAARGAEIRRRREAVMAIMHITYRRLGLIASRPRRASERLFTD